MKIFFLIIFFVCFGTGNYSFAENEATVNTSTITVTNALSALEQNDYEKAVNIYSTLINNSKNALFFYGRGLSHYYLDKNDSAEADFQKAISLDSNYFDAYLGLAFVLMQKTQNSKCNFILNKAAEINPNSSKIFYCKGLLNYIEQNYNDAITDFSTAIKLNNENLNAIYGRAISFYQINNYENAQNDFNEFLSKTPKNVNLADESRRILAIINKK